MTRTTWISAAVAALLAAGLALWRADLGRETTETSPEPIAVTVAGRTLHVPKNAIRFPAQRRAGAQERLDVALLPPAWTGRTAADAERFDAPAESSDVVWVTIRPAGETQDSAERLATVHARLFVDEPLAAAPDLGLVGRKLSPKAGYTGEEVWFEPGAVRPFAVRCYPLAPDAPPATCIGDEKIGPLLVEKRFSRAALGRWREIRDGLAARLADWGLSPDR